MSITTARDKQSASALRPEFFRLPPRGGDPYFGLTRPFYYEAEKDGRIKLVRLRSPGKARGVTLVPYIAVLRMLEAASGSSLTAHKKKGAGA